MSAKWRVTPIANIALPKFSAPWRNPRRCARYIAAAIYLAHLLGLRHGAENFGRAMLAIGVTLHFADIGVRCYHGMNPISSTPDAMSLAAFIIAATYLLTSLRYRLT